MWHIGTADTMFAVESNNEIVWKPEISAYALCEECSSDDGQDSDWTPIDLTAETSSDESDAERDDSEDMDWYFTVPTLPTWDVDVETGTKVSNRCKDQLKPLVL